VSWPSGKDYCEAVQNLRAVAGDEELRAGQPKCDASGYPLVWHGGFADVYRIDCPSGNTCAMKCFTCDVADRQRRYREIAAHLKRVQLPFTVDFEYLQRGLRIRGEWFPVVKMQWVEGRTLNRFIEESLDDPKTLRQLLGLWPKLARQLRENQIAHADIQHGNVLLTPLGLQLIDYDGMYVPALADVPSGELGHGAYQHPWRAKQNIYNADVDRFSHLAIDATIRCLIVGRRGLWRRLNNNDPDALLFRKTDFENPADSAVFRALWNMDDAQARAMVGRLALACAQPPEQSPWLDEVAVDGRVFPLSHAEECRVECLLLGNRSAATGRMVAVQRELLFSPTPASRSVRAETKSLAKSVEYELADGVKLEMVLIAAGEFAMGSRESKKDTLCREHAQHLVRITRPFYLGRYLVTQQQWEAVMNGNPSKFKCPKNPVEQISWDDAAQFLENLSAKVGIGAGIFQLPTEAQWEYACRAENTTRCCFGNNETKLDEYAWYAANSANTTHPVGEKKPNAWGLFDMHGNVWEWCRDWYDDGYYTLTNDPVGPGTGSKRIGRGGGFSFVAWDCRSAARFGASPWLRDCCWGLRVSLIPAK
jgi:formylglycine-generating enzyme required for sulfatase activity